MIGAQEAPKTLSIGVVFGGSPEVDTLWEPETRRVMKSVISHREGVSSPLCLNVVFHIEGRLLPPLDFDGARTGRFSRKTMEVVIQAALPREPVKDRRAALLAAFRDAVAEAEGFARRRKISDGLPEIWGIVDAVEREPLEGNC